jgi:transcriptional regulator with XRE-family HTH domain
MATLGQQLKAAREAKGVSEHEAGEATNILTKTIIAMEADDFSGIAAPTYARGFIRLYAGFLDLDPAPLLQAYQEEHLPDSAPPADKQEAPSSGENPLRAAQDGVMKLFRRVNLKAPGRSAPKAPPGMPSVPAENLRLIAGVIAAVLVLTVLTVSISNCARRRAAERPPRPAADPAPRLLDEPLPDLYLVEPGRIESR